MRLPSFLRARSTAASSFVFLTDAQIGTGAAGFMAIRVLLDHGVPQERIVFIALLASAKGGIHALLKAFPRVRIVVAGVDPGLRKTRVPIHTTDRSSKRIDAADTSLLERSQGRMSLAKATSSTTIAAEQVDLDEQQPTRVCWALLPGAGNIGNRYWRT